MIFDNMPLMSYKDTVTTVYDRFNEIRENGTPWDVLRVAHEIYGWEFRRYMNEDGRTRDDINQRIELLSEIMDDTNIRLNLGGLLV
tara:strand:- start:324 stop:581 length:258 start_codon:yes stop_codon:yes gene_type:complete